MRASIILLWLSPLLYNPVLAAPGQRRWSSNPKRSTLSPEDHVLLDSLERSADEEHRPTLPSDPYGGQPRSSSHQLSKRRELPEVAGQLLNKVIKSSIAKDVAVGTFVVGTVGVMGKVFYDGKVLNEESLGIAHKEGALTEANEKFFKEFLETAPMTVEQGDNIMEQLRNATNVTMREIELFGGIWQKRRAQLMADLPEQGVEAATFPSIADSPLMTLLRSYSPPPKSNSTSNTTVPEPAPANSTARPEA